MSNILKILACLLAVSLLFGCTGSTKPKKGAISGTLILDGQSDHSGITVMVFLADVVSDDIKDVQAQHPQLAFPVRDEHVFDHRSYSALSTVSTTTEGAFSFPKLEYGKYILTFFKEGWGYNSLFEIELNTESYSVNSHFDEIDLNLHQVDTVPAQVMGVYVFEANHTYVVEQDVIATGASNLVFQPNSKVLLAPGKKITVYGTAVFLTGVGRCLITSKSGIYNTDFPNILNGDGLVVFSNGTTIENLCMSYLNSALSIRGNNSIIRDVLVKESNFGITNYQVENINVSGCVFASNRNPNGAAVYNNLVNGLHIDDCVFSQNFSSIYNEVTTSAIIENSSFYGGTKELLNLWDSSATFKHNRVENQGTAVENSGRSNLWITYNHIDAKICVRTYHANNWYNEVNNGWTKADNNNFSATELVVKSEACYYNSGLVYPLDFKQNYWSTTNSQTIAELIVDYHDLGESGPVWVWSEVLFQPYNSSQISNAGI